MIDGYSVQEAASVLGVPEGRVWELLARGVLSGTPEGDSMRVYLKADAAPIATSHRDEPSKTNGDAGSHANGGEASAFRELLTEFRNLTERYGQALLALGEARGEVAGLRSRVELLEARLDLRLPTTPDTGPVPWEPPSVAAVDVATPPVAPPAAEPLPAGPLRDPPRSAPVRRGGRARKAQSTRSAVGSFAQALARAQDPTTAEVGEDVQAAARVSPQVEEAQAPPAEDAIEESPPESEATADASEPVVAEPQLVAEPETIAPEPEPIVAELESAAAELEPHVEPEVAVAELEAEPVVVEPDPAAVALQAAFDEPEAAADEPAASVIEPEVPTEAGVSAPTGPEAAPPTYSAAVVEPDWFADGDFAWLDAAELDAGSRSVESAIEPAPAEPETAAAAAAEPGPAALAPAESEAAAVPTAELEFAEEPASEPISASEPEAALWAEPETIVERDRLSMPDLPPMPDLPAALDLPATPEPQPSPEFEAEPDVAESVVELREQVQRFEVAQGVEPSAAEPAHAEPLDRPAQPDDPTEPFQTRGPDAGPTEEPVMWLGAEDGAAAEMETASSGWRPDPRSAPTITAPPRIARVEPPLLRMTEQELARLARDEGWDDAEVAAIRAMIVPPPAPRVQLPGAAELDEAMAALQAVPVDANEEAHSSREWAKAPAETGSPRYDDWAFEVEPAPQRRIIDPLPPRREPPDPGWLRRRRGPAATAYRRLRRLFPG